MHGHPIQEEQGPSGLVLTIRICPRIATLLLQDPSSDGVGPEPLGGPMLRFDFLCFGGRVWVAGIEHWLQDAPPGVDEPFQGKERPLE